MKNSAKMSLLSKHNGGWKAAWNIVKYHKPQETVHLSIWNPVFKIFFDQQMKQKIVLELTLSS